MKVFLILVRLAALLLSLCFGTGLISPALANDSGGRLPTGARDQSLALAVKETVAAQDARDRSVQAELRRGLDRLSKACVAPTPPNVANSQPLPTDLLERDLREYDRLLTPLSERLVRLLAQADRRRSQLCPVLPLLPKTSACVAVEDNRDGLQALSKAFVSRRNNMVARYSLYEEAGRLEARGCSSPGFSQRLLQADEQHMKPSSNQALGDWGRLLNAAEANLN